MRLASHPQMTGGEVRAQDMLARKAYSEAGWRRFSHCYYEWLASLIASSQISPGMKLGPPAPSGEQEQPLIVGLRGPDPRICSGRRDRIEASCSST